MRTPSGPAASKKHRSVLSGKPAQTDLRERLLDLTGGNPVAGLPYELSEKRMQGYLRVS
jgi:hypothetical protein